MSDSDVSAFGELLRRLRSQRDISQHHLAVRLDVHRNTISKWERGICLPESKTLVLEIARQLQLNMHYTQRLLEASLTAFSPHWYMPSPRNIFFTGREIVLHHMHEKLGREQTAFLYQACALTGLGGVGKTQAAIEYAYRYAHDYTAILWVAAETRESITASFMAIANVLHLPEQDNQNHVIKAVCQWLSEHREWLLIFDNVENLELIRPLLPAARSGAVLLTTRLQYVGDMARTIHLECMTSEEGFLFLLRRAKLLSLDSMEHYLPPQETLAAQEIVMLMGGLPLALDQAGAYIEATQCSLQDYLQLLQSSQLHLLRERDAHADHPLSVSKTFTLSFESLEWCNPQAASLLTICAFLAPEGIPESFFCEGAVYLGSELEVLVADPFCFNAAIKALQAYSFVQRHANTHIIKVHSLVQVVLKGRLPQAVQRLWGKRVIHAMSQLFPSDEKTQANYWQTCELLLPHALVCITLGEQWDEDEASYIALLNRVAAYRAGCAHHTHAESLYMRALYLGNHILGSAHPLVAETIWGLVELYRELGKYKEAEPLYQRALHIVKQTSEKP